jgi:RNA polymerase sigma factor (sigma-70 family)
VQLTKERTRPTHGGLASAPSRRLRRGVRSPAPAATRRPAVPDASLAPLVVAAKAGCSASFERLYRMLAGQVASYLRWHRATDPDGLTNDVFAQVHRNLGRFEGDEQGFRSWVFTIAHHRMIDDRRRASREIPVQSSGAVDETRGCGDVEEDAFAALSRHEIEHLLAVLSPDQREVVLLRIVADLPVEQVARMMDRREGAIKALQHRAVASLRRHLERADIEPAR